MLLLFGLHAQQDRSPTSSSPHQSTTLHLTRSDTAYSLSRDLILQGSESVVLDSARVLRRQLDYEIQYRRGVLYFRRDRLMEILADSASHSVVVAYEVLPFSFKREYYLRQLSFARDSIGRVSPKVEAPMTRFSMDDVFGAGLQKSGSIFRGLTMGSNRDLTLNSGFRMQLAGKLSSDLDIVAALTDENVPIQPEGTTQTLQELDKVFVQLKTPRYSATLGDFVYDIGEHDGGEFGRLSRKLQGAMGMAALQDITGHGSSLAVAVTGATARGRYATNQFQGVEGNQGPYRLTGRDPSRRPIIIAGSERVYVNGQPMTRGETNDYTIDYSTGDVYFSARRLITNATRITVDFEYSDRQFTRNLMGVSARMSALEDRVHVSAALIQEADDPDSPIDLALDDSLRSIIKSSGTNKLRASVSGVRFVGRDSITLAGKGQYILKDTLLAGVVRPLLVYAPGDPQALYAATFSYVDQVPKDSLGYNRSISGGFVSAGLGGGNYLPVQFLPIPELHRVVNGRVSVAPISDLSISAEYGFSSYDRNRLSDIADNDNRGGAYKIIAEYHPKDLKVGQVRLGELELRLSDRFVDRRFVSLDRSNEIEFNRAWNLGLSAAGDEEIREMALNYQPLKTIRLGAAYGMLERRGSFRSRRTILNADVADSVGPHTSYSSEFLQSEDLLLPNKSSWVRQKGDISYGVSKFQTGLRVEMENREEHLPASDSLFRGSFRYIEIAPSVSLVNLDPLRASAELQMRTEDSASGGSMARAFRSLTQLYDLQIRGWNSLSGSVSLALRRSVPADDFAAKGSAGSNTMLIRSQARYAPLSRAVDADVLYEFARERSAAMRRIFIRVPKGTGNYRYKGDVDQTGIADESQFEQTRFDGDYIAFFLPTDQLVPVVDLKTGFHVRFSPAKLLARKESSAEKALGALSTETVARIEEKSTEPDAREIYFLNFSRFQNDSTTISGTNLFTQDLYLFEADPAFSMRFRFNQRRGLLRLVGTTERSYLRERAVRMRAQLLKEIGNQTEFRNKLDQLIASSASPRQRDLLSNELKTEFSYRPYPEWEIAFGMGFSRVTNRFAETNATADLNDQFLRLSYAFLRVGQLRTEIQREEVRVSQQAKAGLVDYPFEFTSGKAIGKTLLWRLAFDYRISQYVQVTINYDGRSEGGASAVHTARAEARAFF